MKDFFGSFLPFERVLQPSYIQDNLQILKDAILNSPENPTIACLNLNSLRNKITDLRILVQDIPLDYFVLSKAKPGKSFPTVQFHIPGYDARACRDWNKYGGGLFEYVETSANREKNKKFETLRHESICSELAFAKKKWLCFSIYRPPAPGNLSSFFLRTSWLLK